MKRCPKGVWSTSIAAAIIGYLLGSQWKSRPSPIGQKQTDAETIAEEKTHGQGDEPQSAKAVYNGWRPKEREHRRRYEWAQNSLLGIGLILSAFAAGSSVWAARQATRQANVAERAQRPWMKVSGIQSLQLSIDVAEVQANYKILVENVGNDPASEISVIPDEVKVYLGEEVQTDYLKDFCEAELRDVGSYYLGNIVFPKEDNTPIDVESRRPLPELTKISDRFANTALENIRRKSGRDIDLSSIKKVIANHLNFILGGCVVYRASDQEYKYTSFAYVVKFGPNNKPSDSDVVIGQGFDIQEPNKYSFPADLTVAPLSYENFAN